MHVWNGAVAVAASLESVFHPHTIHPSPQRPPDYASEIRAMRVLAEQMAVSSEALLTALSDLALSLSGGQSAGVSLLEKADGVGSSVGPVEVFRLDAASGRWKGGVPEVVDRAESPCAAAVERDEPLLVRPSGGSYTAPETGSLPLVEGLIVPFRSVGQPIGAVWVVVHDGPKRFDGEDLRLVESIADFAGAGYAAWQRDRTRLQSIESLRAEIGRLRDNEAAMRQIDRRKDDFMAVLGHELRNSLAPMSNAVEVLQLRSAGSADGASEIGLLVRQVGHCVRLVDDLLDVSRISRGVFELRKSWVDLREVTREALADVRSLADRLGHSLIVSVPDRPVGVHADRARMSQVIGNLLNNACKYMERGGAVRLELTIDGENAVVRIGDKGAGIAADQLQRIFDIFTQVDSSLDRAQGGLGIGLSLVKTLVEAHGGTVEATSGGIGLGSEFILRLPMAASPEAPPRADVQRPSATASPKRVLVVDDSPDAVSILTTILELSGHEVRAAYDGIEAVETARLWHPEVILLDIGLPRLNGYEVARRLRDLLPDGTFRLVALTGWGQTEDRVRSAQAGFDLHLLKPVDLAALRALLAD